MRRLLFVSNLFPDLEHPIRGLDNATLLHSFDHEWEIRALSPRAVLRPWQKVGSDSREQDTVFLPRYVAFPYLPKIGSWCNDLLMSHFLAPAFDSLVGEFKPDAVLCSWLYPDGCAVARLAQRHNLPIVLVTQGTDTHGYLKFPLRRKKIISAIWNSAAVICRSADLAHRLHEAGAEREKLKVIYNGVDTDIFQIRNRDDVRHELNLPLEQPMLLFVGNYLPVKNPLLLIRAHAELNRRRGKRGESLARLVLIGDGPMRSAIEREIRAAGTENTVSLGARETPSIVSRWMNAADLLCLSSYNEGFPNVILEAMASGLRVVSTDVGGIRELVTHQGRGLLVKSDDLDSYVNALDDGLARKSAATEQVELASACDWSWRAAAKKYVEVIESAISSRLEDII